MNINEIEASCMINLIDAFLTYKKGGSLVFFLESCKNSEMIAQNGKFNEADLKYLRGFKVKLQALVKKSEQKTKNNG